MIQLIKTNYIDASAELGAQVCALLNDAFPDGAPNELSGYYSRHGVPTTTMLLREGRRVVGHLAMYERQIKLGDGTVRSSTKPKVGSRETIGGELGDLARGAMIKVLDEPHLDLTTPIGRGFIAFLSALAEDERHRIVKRTADLLPGSVGCTWVANTS